MTVLSLPFVFVLVAVGVVAPLSTVFADPVSELDRAMLREGTELLGLPLKYGTASAVDNSAWQGAVRGLVARGEAGDREAQYQLGRLFENGKGVDRDIGEALRWYEKAAVQDMADAKRAIGVIYLDGKGVPKDYSQALYWFHQGAEQGDEHSQMLLNRMYRFGQGTDKDLVVAHMWNILSFGNVSYGAVVLERDEKSMTRAQIDEAHRLAEEWIANRKAKGAR